MRRTHRRTWIRLAYTLVALAALINGGCLLVAAGAAAGAAAAGAAYYYGKDCRGYNAGFPDTIAATRTALKELGMPIVSEEYNQEKNKGYIDSRTGDGEKVRIHLDVMPPKFPSEGPWTRVCVRVSVFGDHPVGQRILDQVSAHLVSVPTANVPPPEPSQGMGWTPLPDSGTVAPPPPPGTPAVIAPQPPPPGTPPQTAPPPLAN